LLKDLGGTGQADAGLSSAWLAAGDRSNPEGNFRRWKIWRDLTELARRGKIDPGSAATTNSSRNAVLSRRTKNNPVLIGDPGVARHNRGRLVDESSR